MNKFIKTSDRLPDKEDKYFIYYANGEKESCYFNKDNDKDFQWQTSDGRYIENVEEWLDESEEEITDKQRLDWLQKNVVFHHYQNSILECDLKNYILLREFIDNQIKQEQYENI